MPTAGSASRPCHRAAGSGGDRAGLHRASDDEAIKATVMDRRWQLGLDCLDTQRPLFSKGTLVGFRARLIAQHDLDRRLVEPTVALAERTGGFAPAGAAGVVGRQPVVRAGRWRTPGS
jgi:hypothetical protein